MRRFMFGLVLGLSMLPMLAEGIDSENFRVRNTADLVVICATPVGDAMYTAAISFCHGYGVGAYHYYHASHAGPEGKPFVCLPEPPPSRTDGMQMFVNWARANPQFMSEPPVETLFRWLATQWPCPKGR
jgi:hypothetical protein